MSEDQKSNALKTLEYVLSRLKEPSTWAGIAVFIGMFGLSENTMDRILTNGPAIVTAIATLIAIFAPSGSLKAIATAKEAKEIALTTADATGVLTEQVDATTVSVSQLEARS